MSFAAVAKWIKRGMVGSAGICVVLGMVIAGQAQRVVTPDRITAPVDDTRRVVLVGSVHPLARAEFDRGVAPEGLHMDRMLLLLQRTPEQDAALETLLAEQLDP